MELLVRGLNQRGRRVYQRLTKQVDRDFPQKLIQTNRGIGYTLASGSAPPAESNGHGAQPPQSVSQSLNGQVRRA
jgi:hypothetical protein